MTFLFLSTSAFLIQILIFSPISPDYLELPPLLQPSKFPSNNILKGGSSTQYTGDGSVDIDGKPVLRSNTDNWRACPFILGIECCECLAYYGISTNLVTYLTNVLHEGNVSAVRNVTTWAGTCYLAPLIGAVLAYAYWGRYQTIAVFSTIICSWFYIGGDYAELVKEMKLDGFLYPSVIIFSSQWGLPLLSHPPFVSRNVVSLPRKLSLEYIYTLMNHAMHVCAIKECKWVGQVKNYMMKNIFAFTGGFLR